MYVYVCGCMCTDEHHVRTKERSANRSANRLANRYLRHTNTFFLLLFCFFHLVDLYPHLCWSIPHLMVPFFGMVLGRTNHSLGLTSICLLSYIFHFWNLVVNVSSWTFENTSFFVCITDLEDLGWCWYSRSPILLIFSLPKTSVTSCHAEPGIRMLWSRFPRSVGPSGGVDWFHWYHLKRLLE